jgi:Tol biopolymer transport system component
MDRSGKRLSTAGSPARYGHFELSPDEKQVAYEKIDADARHENLWLLDLVRGSTSRLTSAKGSDYTPIWSPDGRKILFASARSGLTDLYEIPAGGGPERVVLRGEGDKNALGWSRDGKLLLFAATFPATGDDLFVLPLSGEARPRPLAQSRFNESDGQISPDSRWFAYASDESGQYEVYVQAFAEGSARVQVSAGGGERPRWRADGRELLFVGRNRLQSSEISGGAEIVAGKPRELFPLRFWSDYTVARDGQRILAAIPAEETPVRPMVVVLNWDGAR